jgi:cytochrome c peroxidase
MHDQRTIEPPTVLAPGYGDLGFAAPEPGTYRLPPIRPAADGDVLLDSSEHARLHEAFGTDRLVLLSFIYTVCPDAHGCPLASFVLQRIHRELQRSADLAGRIRLISLSFDPETDLPAVMREYARQFDAQDSDDWVFLTGESNEALQPLLDAYGQGVARIYDEKGRYMGHVANVAFLGALFHDGREETLEQQAWQPMLHPNEMASPSIGFAIDRIRSLPDYAGRFEAAFDGRGPDLETVPMALASYQRTLVSANSAFDRWHFGGKAGALDEAAIRGLRLFTGRAGCVACHTIEAEHALFTDQRLHNTGVGYTRSQRREPEPVRVWLAPGVSIDVSAHVIRSVGAEQAPDLGRYRVTGDPNDRWSFRTPSLRNVALTAPYMHDGSLATLDAVVAFYDAGGTPNPLLSPLIRPLGLSASERTDLVAFLRALTGEYRSLVLDAFAAPLGDVGIERRPPAAPAEDG